MFAKEYLLEMNGPQRSECLIRVNAHLAVCHQENITRPPTQLVHGSNEDAQPSSESPKVDALLATVHRTHRYSFELEPLLDVVAWLYGPYEPVQQTVMAVEAGASSSLRSQMLVSVLSPRTPAFVHVGEKMQERR